MIGKAVAISAILASVIWQAGAGLAAREFKLKYGIASVSFVYAPLYIAEDQGFFKQEGVNIEAIQLGGSSPAASATISGSVNFYVGLPQTAALAIAKGEKLSTFAVIAKQYGSDIVVSKEVADRLHLVPTMPVEERLNALKGLKVASWSPGGSPDMLIRFIAAKKHWTPEKDLTILPIGPSGPMLAALENKRIDAFAFSAPTSLQAVERNEAFLLFSGAKGEWAPLANEPYMCLIGNTDWLAKDPDAAAAVYRGLVKAMDFMRKNPDAAKALMRKRLSAFDDAAFEGGYKDLPLLIPDSPKVGPAEAKMIKEFVETIYPAISAPLDKLVDEEIGKRAGG
ncbi:ABC transporter substrate-binding protein [Roseiarcaceae bacterium H3SJ34-1]|uniref:ABC transporter substrate-binding protein n=1 Tax=Terripilifer ovatus TaxID=3032367 RepID=UPI003AB9667C|nr:ABC transporter substrate-binding protein [Roseiarcaceae bacterium H3SJ34-1]